MLPGPSCPTEGCSTARTFSTVPPARSSSRNHVRMRRVRKLRPGGARMSSTWQGSRTEKVFSARVDLTGPDALPNHSARARRYCFFRFLGHRGLLFVPTIARPQDRAPPNPKQEEPDELSDQPCRDARRARPAGAPRRLCRPRRRDRGRSPRSRPGVAPRSGPPHLRDRGGGVPRARRGRHPPAGGVRHPQHLLGHPVGDPRHRGGPPLDQGRVRPHLGGVRRLLRSRLPAEPGDRRGQPSHPPGHVGGQRAGDQAGDDGAEPLRDHVRRHRLAGVQQLRRRVRRSRSQRQRVGHGGRRRSGAACWRGTSSAARWSWPGFRARSRGCGADATWHGSPARRAGRSSACSTTT